MERLTIAFIEPGLHICGGIRRVMEVSNRLVTFGHDVSIFTPDGSPCTWIRGLARVHTLESIGAFRFDACVFNLAAQYPLALRTQATKRIFWVLAPEAEYKKPRIPVAALRQEFHFLANSTYVVQYIKKYAPSVRDIPVIPGGINPEHFRHDPAIPKTYDAMFYGSKRPWKGTALIEEALSGLDVRTLKMEGSGTSQVDMYRLYCSAAVYVSAGLAEGFNFPLLEAMACGTPVICTDDGGSRDFVVSGTNATVVARRTADIREAVSKLLGDKALRTHLSLEGLRTASDPQYDWDHVTRRVEAELHRMVND